MYLGRTQLELDLALENLQEALQVRYTSSSQYWFMFNLHFLRGACTFCSINLLQFDGPEEEYISSTFTLSYVLSSSVMKSCSSSL